MTFFIPLIFILQLLFSIFYFFGYLRLKSGLNCLSYSIQESATRPSVSIIISLHNEEANIPALIQHLTMQKYPNDLLEIIFIDDRSGDKTYELLSKNHISNFSVKLLKIEETSSDFAPKKYAITQAVSQASGDILLFTDADGRPGPNWVSTMVSHFSNETGMVLGYAPYATHNPFNGTIFRILALEYLSHAAVSAASTGLGYPVTCVGTNLAYRKTVFQQLSGYGKFSAVHTGDDDLLLQRVREETDWQIRYATADSSHVFNAPPENMNKFYNQRLRYASKGFLYPLKFKSILIFFYFYNLLYFINLIFMILNPSWFPVYLIALLIKYMIDYSFMRRAAKILHDRRHLSLIPVTLMFHIPYVIYFGLVSQIQTFKWAGRKG